MIAGTTVDHEGVPGKVRFKGIARLKPEGGELAVNDTSIVVQGADAVTIYISIATNFNSYKDVSGNENERAVSYLNEAYSKSFASILKAHVEAYQGYFNRVKLDLGITDAAKLPTDERLKNFSSTHDPDFVTLYFQFGRYLLISSSQPGGQPINLQGIWNDKMKPPWDSKYTININAEMNYWPAEKTNLAELHEPFLQMVIDLSEIRPRDSKGDVWCKRLDGSSQHRYLARDRGDRWSFLGSLDGRWWMDLPTSLGTLFI